MEDIVLFLKYNFHKAGMIPISKCLTELGVPHTLTSKRHLIYDHFNETKKKFKLMVIGDEWNLFKDCAEEIMTIGHSMVDKNTTFSSKNSEMDYICVPSQYYKNEFIKRGISPKKEFFITGFPYADRIFNKQWKRDTWWHNDALKKKILRKNILFVPTYNAELNLVEDFIKAGIQFWKSNLSYKNINFKFAIKPHPVFPKKNPIGAVQLEKFEDSLGKDNFYYHNESHDDIADAILWSDVIVGDCSGALLLGVAGDKPILAFNNPHKEKSGYYSPNSLEWTLRDKFATTFENFNMDFASILHDQIRNDPKKASRTEIKHLLYGEYQGDSAMQIALRIKNLQ